MYIESYVLAMSDAAKSLIESSGGYRQGGVIYTNAGRIFEHLHDSNIIQNSNTAVQNLASVSVVPMAIFGASMIAINHRLAKIEEILQKLHKQLLKIVSELNIINIKLDAQLIGKLNGTIHACQIEISENRNDRLSGYRQSFVEYYNQLKPLSSLWRKNKTNSRFMPIFFLSTLRPCSLQVWQPAM